MGLKKKFSGIAEGVISIKKRIWFTVILIVALFSAVLFYAFYSFGHSGLDRALVGLVEGDGYSSWDHWNKSEKTSALEDKSNIFTHLCSNFIQMYCRK